MNYTKKLQLTQYQAEDKFSVLGRYNADMSIIEQFAEQVDTKVEENTNKGVDHDTRIEHNEENITTLMGSVRQLTELTADLPEDEEKINELDTRIQTQSLSLENLKTSIDSTNKRIDETNNNIEDIKGRPVTVILEGNLKESGDTVIGLTRFGNWKGKLTLFNANDMGQIRPLAEFYIGRNVATHGYTNDFTSEQAPLNPSAVVPIMDKFTLAKLRFILPNISFESSGNTFTIKHVESRPIISYFDMQMTLSPVKFVEENITVPSIKQFSNQSIGYLLTATFTD